MRRKQKWAFCIFWSYIKLQVSYSMASKRMNRRACRSGRMLGTWEQKKWYLVPVPWLISAFFNPVNVECSMQAETPTSLPEVIDICTWSLNDLESSLESLPTWDWGSEMIKNFWKYSLSQDHLLLMNSLNGESLGILFSIFYLRDFHFREC